MIHDTVATIAADARLRSWLARLADLRFVMDDEIPLPPDAEVALKGVLDDLDAARAKVRNALGCVGGMR